MNSIRPQRLTWDNIRSKETEIRLKLLPDQNKIPVPIEEIIAFGQNIEIRPIFNLKNDTDIEGLLLSDLKTIIVDSATYYEDKYQKRLRFTLAHELGHFVLHSEQIIAMKFNSVEEWIRFRENMNEDDLDWFERQAHEFAGSILVPSKKLIDLIEKNKEKIKKYLKESSKNKEEAKETAILSISRLLSDEFNVSSDVIRKRILVEKIWDNFDFND